MKDNCLVSIIGSQIIDGKTNKIELTTFGSYYIKGNNYWIIYREYNENLPHKKIINMLKIYNDDTVVLTKKGEISSKLILEKAKSHICYYNIREGSLIANIFTKNVIINLDEKGGNLKINYLITIDKNFCSFNTIDVKVKLLKNKL